MSQIVSQAKEVLDRKLWGGRSLHVGELIVLVLALLVWFFRGKLHLGDKWSMIVVFGMIFLAFLIW